MKDPGIPQNYPNMLVREHIVVWSVVKNINGKAHLDFCKLCLTEKYFNMHTLGDNRLINKNLRLLMTAGIKTSYY